MVVFSIKCLHFRQNNCFLLILRIFISFTKQFFTFHSNRVKCKKQILPWVGFEPTTSCIRGKRLNARPRGPHGRERTTPRLIWKYLESIFIQRYPPDTGMQTLAANAGGRGFESHRGQNLFFTFYSIRVECEELFCKTDKNS